MDKNEYDYSVVIPVYRNAPTLQAVIEAVRGIAAKLAGTLEVVFVVDGSPDESAALLESMLPESGLAAQLLVHSRNFGSFAAIRTGLKAARGRLVSVMAADLQEPPDLIVGFFRELEKGECDIVVGRREGREDPALSVLASKLFWSLYRRLVNPEIPRGGVDVFGCNREVVEELVKLNEADSSLVGLLYWMGFRRRELPYVRAKREHGKSGWTFRKKVRYLLDSVFSFTNLPISLLTAIGFIGGLTTLVVGIVVFLIWLLGGIAITGYTPLMLTILFSAFLNIYGIGIVGSYVWRTFQNSKMRPQAIVMRSKAFGDDDA